MRMECDMPSRSVMWVGLEIWDFDARVITLFAFWDGRRLGGHARVHHVRIEIRRRAQVRA